MSLLSLGSHVAEPKAAAMAGMERARARTSFMMSLACVYEGLEAGPVFATARDRGAFSANDGV